MAQSTGEGVRPRVPDHVWLPTIFAATAVVLLTGVLLVRTGFDPSRLVRAAPPWTDPANTLPSLTVLPHEYEFDGQFFYRLAVAPFSNAASVAGVTFDLPALRGSRWGFGLAGYLLSAGQPALVPWSLLVVNAGCLVLLAVIGGGFAQSSGRHALWGLLLPLWPGFAYTLTLDTAELLTSVFLMGSLLAARRRAFVWTAVLASAAAVTRETAVVGAVGLVVAGLMARTTFRRHRPAVGQRSVGRRSGGALRFLPVPAGRVAVVRPTPTGRVDREQRRPTAGRAVRSAGRQHATGVGR